jgi:hypothetical protein
VVITAGWIKLHRDIVNKPIYSLPPLYARVFERLILEANRECTRIPYGKSETKLIRRGEKLTSIGQIAGWVGWYERGIFKVPNKKTISKILDWLVKYELIEIYNKGNARETHYNVLNYCIYQARDNEESNAQVTPEKRPLDTNKNIKNLKKEKNLRNTEYISSSKVFADDADETLLASELKDYILQNNPSARVPDNLNTWAKTFDLMIRVDKRTVEDIRSVMQYSQTNSFWIPNILSAAKLREKYDTLKMQKDRIPQKSGQPNKVVDAQKFGQREYTDSDLDSLFVDLEASSDTRTPPYTA